MATENSAIHVTEKGEVAHSMGAGQHDATFHHRDYANLPEGQMAPAFGGGAQPGLWKPYEHRKYANPAPMGLLAFAVTTFVLSCVNLEVRGVTAPNIAVPLAFGYGGIVQTIAGMWYVSHEKPGSSWPRRLPSLPSPSPSLPLHFSLPRSEVRGSGQLARRKW